MTPYVAMLQNYVRPESQGAFAYEYRMLSKDPVIAQMLAIVLGLVGGEGYYLGDWRRGVWMTLALLSGIGTLITVPMWIVRCFTVASECDAYNDYLAYTLVQRHLAYATGSPGVQPPPPTSATSRRTISRVPVAVKS